MIIKRLFNSSIGNKFLVAISGLAMVLFLIAHLMGNLQIFISAHAINQYAWFLKQIPEITWAMRIGLLVMIIIHIFFTIKLTIANKKARPQAYAIKKAMKATLSSRTMAVSGLIVLSFIIFHLMHFTFLVTHPEISHSVDENGWHDVYKMVVLSFQQPHLVFFYLLALTLLFSHLHHGVQSLFHTLGLTNKNWSPLIDKGGKTLALLLYLGYISIPISILLGLVK